MSKERICDICKKNEASRSFKIKLSLKGAYERTSYGLRWNPSVWSPYEKVDVCGECGEKMFGLPYRDAMGFGRLPKNKV